MRQGPTSLLDFFALFLVFVYRNSLGRMMLGSCRFVPSCSEYARLSIKSFGAFRGSLRILRRLMRCHPFSKGVVDPVQ